MKPGESRDLVAARKLLSEFEGDMAAPDALNKLSEALSLLSYVVDSGGTEGPLAGNIVTRYTAKAVAAADAILDKPGEASAVELRRWENLLGEFERCGFESPLVVAAQSRLSKRLASRYVSGMTRAEKEVLLRKLEEDSGKGQS